MGIDLVVADIGETAAVLAKEGVAWLERKGALRPRPHDACGAALGFVSAGALADDGNMAPALR